MVDCVDWDASERVEMRCNVENVALCARKDLVEVFLAEETVLRELVQDQNCWPWIWEPGAV
jgi:hypothetical protein